MSTEHDATRLLYVKKNDHILFVDIELEVLFRYIIVCGLVFAIDDSGILAVYGIREKGQVLSNSVVTVLPWQVNRNIAWAHLETFAPSMSTFIHYYQCYGRYYKHYENE